MAKILIRKYQATIYSEGDGFTGAISLGFDKRGRRRRVKRKGRTQADVKDKLINLVDDWEAGLKEDRKYTVGDAVRDWLARGTKSLGDGTVNGYHILAEIHVIPLIGAVKLRELTADDVDEWLDGLTGTLSTRSLQSVHSILRRSIRQGQARDKVVRNVAGLVTTPKGTAGRPSKALTLDQATAVLEHARKSPLYPYVALSLMTGVRTEEARALRWDHVVTWVERTQRWRPVTEAGFRHKRFAAYVWRSVRVNGETKTERSRRSIEIPAEAAVALKALYKQQAAQRLRAGGAWQDNNLVFCTRIGTPLSAANVRRSFRSITTAAGIGETWTPRELRHSFVSIMSDNGVTIEDIADMVGHKTTNVTQKVYRHQLKPVITSGATTMNAIFDNQRRPAAKKKSVKSA